MKVEILKKDTPIEGEIYDKGATVEVSDEYGRRLIDFGFAREASTGRKAVPHDRPRTAEEDTGRTADVKPERTAGKEELVERAVALEIGPPSKLKQWSVRRLEEAISKAKE